MLYHEANIMTLSTQPYKGARDFYPPEKRLQKYLFGVMRQVVESYGYEEYDAPIIEPLEIYQAKSGSELVNEQTYTFEDRGGRKVTLRPEMTPTVSRMVAGQRQELAYPLRWYSIPNLWRYERPQRGRLREHWQLNVDIFGVAGLEADAEIIQVANKLLLRYKATPEMYAIRVNSRKLVEYILKDYCQLGAETVTKCIHLIDKKSKMEPDEFKGLLEEVIGGDKAPKLLEVLAVNDVDSLPEDLQKHDSINELRELLKMLQANDVNNAVFDITLMRGFDYYTDVVFEVFDKDPGNPRAMFGGGRYDGLVGLFGAEPVASVGFGMGDVTLHDFLEVHGLLPTVQAETDVYVALINDVAEQAQATIDTLRDQGLKVAVDFSNRPLDAQIKSALKKGVNFVLFIGSEEISSGQFTLKNLATREETKVGVADIAKVVKVDTTS
jgi:histidyl-tRNA synthetase